LISLFDFGHFKVGDTVQKSVKDGLTILPLFNSLFGRLLRGIILASSLAFHFDELLLLLTERVSKNLGDQLGVKAGNTHAAEQIFVVRSLGDLQLPELALVERCKTSHVDKELTLRAFQYE